MVNKALRFNVGLDAWAYLDERYYDGTNNVLKDRGTNRNDFDVSGGVGVSEQGPYDFKSFNFDGVDDSVSTADNSPLSSPDKTVFAIAQNERPDADDNGLSVVVGNEDGSNGYRLMFNNNNDIEWNAYDGNGGKVKIGIAGDGGLRYHWYKMLALYDADSGRTQLYVSDDYSNEISHYSEVGDTGYTAGQAPFSMGSYGGSRDLFEGKIATAAKWNRVLSEVEIYYLLNLTTPIRSTY